MYIAENTPLLNEFWKRWQSVIQNSGKACDLSNNFGKVVKYSGWAQLYTNYEQIVQIVDYYIKYIIDEILA